MSAVDAFLFKILSGLNEASEPFLACNPAYGLPKSAVLSIMSGDACGLSLGDFAAYKFDEVF